MLSLRFNHLLVVLKIHDTGSLSETARQLNLTISAVSRSLRKCQEEFGDELFVRNYQGMAPTEKCRAVVPIIRKLLANFNDLTDTKTFAPADITRTLSIAAADNAVVMILRPVLRALLREAPQMNFRLLPLSENVFRELAEGSVDLALFPTSLGETLPEHFYGLKLFDIHRVCLLRKDLKSFLQYYPLGKSIGYARIPESYQEAIVYAWGLQHKDMTGIPYPIDSNVLNRVNAYGRIYTSYANAEPMLRQQYSGTYWYYLHFR